MNGGTNSAWAEIIGCEKMYEAVHFGAHCIEGVLRVSRVVEIIDSGDEGCRTSVGEGRMGDGVVIESERIRQPFWKHV